MALACAERQKAGRELYASWSLVKVAYAEGEAAVQLGVTPWSPPAIRQSEVLRRSTPHPITLLPLNLSRPSSLSPTAQKNFASSSDCGRSRVEFEAAVLNHDNYEKG